MALKKELIYIDDVDKTDAIASIVKVNDTFQITYKSSEKSYTYSSKRLNIKKSGIQTPDAKNIFAYLNRIAAITGFNPKDKSNVLERIYAKISFIPKEAILSNFLNLKQPPKNSIERSIDIFPFGFNLSQNEAVNNAFNHPLSIIEGPPGTGKTQTILNIIANAVMQDKTVAIVSNSNSATKNVYEKLEKNGLDFIAAVLGNSENKKEFIASQSVIPDLSSAQLSAKRHAKMLLNATELHQEISNNLSFKNELALVIKEITAVETEHRHFKLAPELKTDTPYKLAINSDKLLSLWMLFEKIAQSDKPLKWWNRLWYQIKYRIRDSSFFDLDPKEIIALCQATYYTKKLAELNTLKSSLEAKLNKFSFDQKMKTYTDLSMLIFKNSLYNSYKGRSRKVYELRDLQHNVKVFMQDFPVVMSTAFSLRSSLSDTVMYDYVIVDEASQVDIATGALSLSCARNIVIVGDLKQLPHIVTRAVAKQTNEIFDAFRIPESFRHAQHSLLSAVLSTFPLSAKTLLKEHYRCHPSIIEFCNQKFYNNELIVHTAYESEVEPLLLYKTNAGNHARDRVNQRQIAVIKEEIIPQNNLANKDLGIVSPYRNQTDELQVAFKNTRIVADTVDKFQGRENDYIILCSVDNEITEFTDNANRLNVAISRAIKQLIVLIHGNETNEDTNYADFVHYVAYNNFSIIESDIRSVFDYLYKCYEKQRKAVIAKYGSKSEFDSENLMYAAIADILAQVEFSKYDVVLHYPLKNIIRNYSKLSPEEERYALHGSTHVDFLIYNKLGKRPALVVEVDGYSFHQAHSRQAERDRMKDAILSKYGIPLIRLCTTGSDEQNKIEKLLRTL